MMLEVIKNKLIVSVQAQEGEPLYSPFILSRMACSVASAGAIAIRCEGVENIREIKKMTKLPVIGIIKTNYFDSDVYITPTVNEVKKLISIQCDMVALDATFRKRPNNEKLEDLIAMIKEHGLLTMADISTFDEAVYAQKLGFDCVSTTLVGYTTYSSHLEGPDVSLIRKLSMNLDIPVIAEGKINTPQDLKNVMMAGAYSAVVGSAITRPHVITKRFIDVL